MIRVDCEDAFWGEGFQTGALVDIGSETFRVWLCVRVPSRRAMQLYVTL